jgi:hypothetical protein
MMTRPRKVLFLNSRPAYLQLGTFSLFPAFFENTGEGENANVPEMRAKRRVGSHHAALPRDCGSLHEGISLHVYRNLNRKGTGQSLMSVSVHSTKTLRQQSRFHIEKPTAYVFANSGF